MLVEELSILSVLNGTFAVEKIGPKSAIQRSYNFDTPKYNSEQVISKSKSLGVYVKHMASEILLMLSYNKNLIPHLVISNMLTFMFDLRESIFKETSREHELAVEAEINIAQTVAKIFIHTNPVLI